jgi:hypothetical protein
MALNVRKESRGRTKDPTAIQARVIRESRKGDFSIIFDDDDSGEAADVVAIKIIGASRDQFLLVQSLRRISWKRDRFRLE